MVILLGLNDVIACVRHANRLIHMKGLTDRPVQLAPDWGVANFIDIRIESDEPHNWDTAVYTVAADSRHKQRVSHSAEARPHSEKSSGNADANGLDSAEVPHSRLLPDKSHFCLASEYVCQDNRSISCTKPSNRCSTNRLLGFGPPAFAMSFHPAAGSAKSRLCN